MKEVKLIRIISGEEIITEVLDSGDGYLVIKNPLVVIPQQGQVGFAPWATVIDTERPEISLDMKHVIYCVEVQPDVANRYNEIFGSNIITPDKQLIV
tara:strand:+ start:309 stop:599 length:291 start_codon:yes stop_codon:yes gene_type:complete